MDRWRGKVAVVTGASAGMGLAIAKALVKQGMIVVGLALRRDEMIQAMSGIDGQFHARACDVSKEQDVIEAFKNVKQSFNTLSVLINNAGIIQMKTIEESDTADLRRVIDVNLMGPVYCYKHGIKLMKENDNEGHIININSVQGHKVLYATWFGHGGNNNHSNVYPASKHAVTALSETFINELMGSHIRVTNLSPGYTQTDIFDASHLEASGGMNDPSLKPEDIADAVVYVIGCPAHVQITQLTIKPLGEAF